MESIPYKSVLGLSRDPVLMVQLTGAANYYDRGLRFLRFDHVSPDGWQALREWQRRSSATIRAALAPFEHDQFFPVAGPRFPCDWQFRGTYRRVTFWACAPPRTSLEP
jgi:hypothetical protein